jgi:tetratricopeptide (TPR) repeat protein
MKVSPLVVGLTLALFCASQASALDSIRKHNNQRVSGTLKSVTATEATIDVTGGKLEKIPVTDIESIEYDGEPNDLKLARSALKSGSDKNALVQLDKIKLETVVKPEVRADIAFYRAYANARMALAGAGNIKDAGGMMFQFASTNTNNYHYLQAQEMLGELLVADGNIDAALKAYALLDASPIDEYKMRAGTARGRALLSQKKYPEAQAEFEKVLTIPFNPMTQKGTSAESQRFAAVLGKAQCQAYTGGFEDAIKELEGNIIANINPEEAALQALAYNTLGNCYNQKPDGKKSALLAFLHVDVLYNSVPAAHAEALWNLSGLWVDIGKNERGQECLNRLNRLYPGSPWITKKR